MTQTKDKFLKRQKPLPLHGVLLSTCINAITCLSLKSILCLQFNHWASVIRLPHFSRTILIEVMKDILEIKVNVLFIIYRLVNFGTVD